MPFGIFETGFHPNLYVLFCTAIGTTYLNCAQYSMRKLTYVLLFFLAFPVPFLSKAQQPRLIIPSGHMFQVRGGFFSQDERYIITWSESIKIWEASSGKLIRTIEREKQYPDDVYLFDDNKTIVAAYDDSIVFRNFEDGSVIRSFAGNSFNINESSNAFVLMDYNDDDPSKTKNARLYDLKSFRLKHVFNDPIASASDNNTYISVNFGSTNIFDSTFREMYSVREGTIVGVSRDFSIVALHYDSTLNIVNTRTKKVLHTIPTGKYDQYSLVFVPEANRILVKVTPNELDKHNYMTQQGDVHFYAIDAQSFKVVNRFPEQKGNLELWDFEGEKVAASFTDSTVRVWDIASGKLISEIKDTTGHSRRVSIAPSKKFMLASSNRSSAKIWNIEKRQLHLQLEETTSYLSNIRFSRDGNLALMQRSEDTWVWDVKKGRPAFSHPSVANRRTKDVHFSADERSVYILTEDIGKTEIQGNSLIFTMNETDNNRLEVYDLQSASLLKNIDLPEQLYRFSFHTVKNEMLLGFADSTIASLDINSGKIITRKTIPAWPNDIAYIEEGKYFVVVAAEHFLVFDAATMTQVAGFTEGADIASYKYDHKTGTAVVMLNDRRISVWNVPGKKQLYEYAGTRKHVNTAFDKEVYKIIFDKTMRYAVMKGVVDSMIVVIDLKTGETGKSISLQSYTAGISINAANNLMIAVKDFLLEWSLEKAEVVSSSDYKGEEITGIVESHNHLVALNRSELKILDKKDKKLLYAVFLLPGGNYAVTDEHQRFDGSENARKKTYLTCGMEIVELEQVKDQLWVPNLGERIMKSDVINAPKISELNICGLTPLVESSEQKENYRFVITPRKGGIGETVVYVNNIEVKRVSSNALTRTGKHYELLVPKTTLLPFFTAGRENAVTVKAYTASNDISSRGVTINTKSQAKEQSPPNLYAVMIGVSDYKGDELDLKYAAKDAEDLSAALSGAAKKLLNTDGKEHVFMYNINTSANRTGFPEKQTIRLVFDEIGKKAKANDILLIFFAGHGVMAGEQKQFYFLTAEASRNSDVASTGISVGELNEWMKPSIIKAQKRVLIFDACNSGQAINDLVTIGSKDDKYVAARNDDESNRIKAVEKLNERSGLFILSASASDQFAYELGKFSQGVLTYSLLKTIKEQPDILDDGKYLNVDKWFAAAEKSVSDIVSQTGNRQNPQKFGTGGFNVGVVDKDVLTKIVLPMERPLFTSSNFQNSDEAIAYDDLEISKLVNQQLTAVSVRGVNSKVSYVSASNSPDAYTLGGRYEVKGDNVSVRVNVIRNKQVVHRFEVNGSITNLDSISEKIVQGVEAWIQ